MSSAKKLNFIMISAMYENGGNTTHRMLDGHPELHVYPFESQLGTGQVSDFLLSLVPYKYRWPEFPLTAGDPLSDYEAFFDEELKTLLRVPGRSKFRDAGIQMDESERRRLFVEWMSDKPRTRANIVDAFFHSTFAAWKNLNRSGKETAYLGYSPVIGLDGDRMMRDFPDGHVIHVVRNPYSGYADTKKRPFPLSLARYSWTWSLMQQFAMTYSEKFPKNFHIVRFEDLVADPRRVMTDLCAKLGLSFSETTLYPSWNGTKLESVFPWGTIRTPTTEANLATMNELSQAEHDEMASLTGVMRRVLGYGHM